MKKTLVSALTTALVVGAASTTFAASNPFSDVPADHWAYDAVSQLAADGVIEGYGDSTFQGNKNITRYEMAQMVAKAMAKTDVSAADKAMIDKLAAEFADELNNLGVRVANLEKHADNVKFTGKLEYTYTSTRMEDASGKTNKKNADEYVFRLEPTAEVNDHWDVHARLDGTGTMDGDTTDNVKLKRAWAQGNYKNFTVKLGKQELYTNEHGLVFDETFSGANLEFGKDLKATLLAGRISADTLSREGDALPANGLGGSRASVYGDDAANFLKNITSVNVGENTYRTGRRGVTIVDPATGEIKMDAKSGDTNVFAGAGKYSISVTATGYSEPYNFEIDTNPVTTSTTSTTNKSAVTTTTASKSGSKSASKTTSKSDSPKTGDTSAAMPIAALAAAGVCAAAFSKRRK